MSELAQKLIAENKAKHDRGEDASYLDLGRCGLTALPDLSGMDWLETLIFSKRWLDWSRHNWKKSSIKERNKLLKGSLDGYLPSGLRVLYLDGDDLRSWEISNCDFLKGLTQLQSLNLSSNQISNFDFLKGLTQLQSLDLSDNQISNCDFLKDLTQLQSLDLSYNKISNCDFLKGLTQLQSLDLSYNKISNCDFLKGLTQLQSLDLSYNKISNLEPFLPLIRQGHQVTLEQHNWIGINLYKNPLTNPPLEIVQQGNDAILRYFEDLEKSGSDQIYEAKLLLIGEGGAGKTTLCRKLFDPNAEMPHEKDRTRGIDIHPLYFDLLDKDGKQFRLNIWDFAGQGKYQSAHSFFYTHRSLYVLVDDTRTLNEDDAYRTLYNNWLQTAELFGGKSPVLVLHNEKEGCARTGFSLGGFQERFDFVHGELFRINLGGGDVPKLTKLKNRIQELAAELPHIGDTVPKTWVKVREAIEKEKEQHAFISAERYGELCTAEGITDPERQSGLSHYFHDLGVFLHFQDNPLLKRDIFLNNTWVTDAVYKILDDSQIAEEQRGRFDKGDLVRLWHESSYRDRRDELLALMLQFELCYQVQDTTIYVCPQLLPGDLPTYDLGTGIPLQLKYEYAFMPKGLLYRLIVRLHRHIAKEQSAVWNSGVVLERAGARAEIIESLDRRTISIRATGVRAKELVTIINEEIERLHAPFGDRLKVTVKIPCNCRLCKESEKPHFYNRASLDNRLSKGKMTVECDVSFDEVNVIELLDGVFAVRKFFTPDDIKVFFKSGEIQEALDAMCEMDYSDAFGLKANYASAKKEYNGDRISHEQFSKVSSQVTTSALDLLKSKEKY